MITSDYVQIAAWAGLCLLLLAGAPLIIMTVAKLAAYGWSLGLRNFERDNTTHRRDVCQQKKEQKNDEAV